ncbi:MAG TPA: sigma factor-like helix-turn-helix DNA-binding protein, partial [Thermoanaerobaculia bacterium]|nr:sigma factor-like helix-turn-helix DNA-binding protein [Thermoanaerobaculia bacterium]HUM29783.1 sigma factor-like helix-turn-helix DNA-binding protein [Thermoanaerobaculia bacterium]HXK67083.1 sigma factor-like helix-turn-helix DNA-binding protein [Thermoanaerobaculia bacterium]
PSLLHFRGVTLDELSNVSHEVGMPRSRTRRPLRGKDSEIMVVKQVGGMSNVEIAERYGVTEGAIRYRLKRLAAGATDRRTERMSGVYRYEGIISTWVSESSGQRRRPAITLLHGRLVSHHGFTLSYKVDPIHETGIHEKRPRHPG